jgi:hypothetical protein
MIVERVVQSFGKIGGDLRLGLLIVFNDDILVHRRLLEDSLLAIDRGPRRVVGIV